MVPGRVKWIIHREAKVVLIKLDESHFQFLRVPELLSKFVCLELIVAAEHRQKKLQDLEGKSSVAISQTQKLKLS